MGFNKINLEIHSLRSHIWNAECSALFSRRPSLQSNSYWGIGKAIPVEFWTGPEGSRRLRFPDSRHSAYEGRKVVSPMHWRPWLIYVTGWFNRSGVGNIMSMKNSSDTIGNRTRDLPTCSAVPVPIATALRLRTVYLIEHCYGSILYSDYNTG